MSAISSALRDRATAIMSGIQRKPLVDQLRLSAMAARAHARADLLDGNAIGFVANRQTAWRLACNAAALETRNT